jgi:DnaK suppressor protein
LRRTDDAMDDLTEAQYQELATLLAQQADGLLAKARSGLELSMSRDRDGARGDSLDESTEEELYSTELRLRDREKKLLSKIRDAQERLAQHEINECEDCGGVIGFKRLMVRPVTTLCIDCKEMREREEEASDGPLARRGGPESLDDGRSFEPADYDEA